MELMNQENPSAVSERPSSFRLGASFVIRHSSFVIRIPRLLLALALALSLTACGDKRISKANVEQVSENMSKKQVESILGPPTEIDNKDFLVMKKTTYVYRQGKETITIVFKDDKLVEKQSTLSE
jgi:uncharacterized lipoprotein YehR (DUF1307 family)